MLNLLELNRGTMDLDKRVYKANGLQAVTTRSHCAQLQAATRDATRLKNHDNGCW